MRHCRKSPPCRSHTFGKAKGGVFHLYAVTYTCNGVSMMENGVANVWLRDTEPSGDGECACGCGDPNCGCQEKDCGGNCCGDKGCGEDHHFILMDK